MDLAGGMTALDLVLDQWVNSQDLFMTVLGGMITVDLALDPWMTFQDMALPMDLDPCMTVLVGMTTIALDLVLTMALAGGMTSPAHDTARLMTTMHHMETFP